MEKKSVNKKLINILLQGYNPDFEKGLYSDAYFGLLHESGKTIDGFDLPISFTEYKDGFCIFVISNN